MALASPRAPALEAPEAPTPVAKAPVVAWDLPGLRRGLVALLPDLQGRALRLTGARDTAADLVQDTVERALRFEGQYLRGSNLRAWAYQILFSVFITRYRRNRRHRAALRRLGDDPCAWTRPGAFEAEMAAGSLTPSTERELSALPEGFRQVVVLVDLEDRSYREAAGELGLPLGTVMSRLHRGRKLLAEKLQEAA